MYTVTRVLMMVVTGAMLGPASGCTATGSEPRTRLAHMQGGGLSKAELSDLMEQFESEYQGSISAAADRLLAATPDRRTRRLTLLWRARMTPMVDDVLSPDDPMRSLLDVWVLCVRMRQFFESGDGKEMFGANQSIATETAVRLDQSVEQIAARILTPKALVDAREAIGKLAQRFPLRGEFIGAPVRSAVQKPETGRDALTTLLSAPLAPFRAIEGVDRTAAAIAGFTAVAARMTDVVHDLPESTMLQLMLVLMEAEGLDGVQSALTSFETLSASSQRLATTAETLPEDVRRELDAFARNLDTRHDGLRRTLGDAVALVDRVRETLAQAQQTVEPIDRAAEQTARAGDAWAAMFATFNETVRLFKGDSTPDAQRPTAPAATRGAGDAAAPAATRATTSGRERPVEPNSASAARAGQSGEPASGTEAAAGAPDEAERGSFDINDWTRAAEAFDRAALRLQEATREIRGLAEGRQLPEAVQTIEQRLDVLLGRTRGSALDLTDHVAWRAAQLIALVFALAIVYRLIGRVRATKPVGTA
jgi:exonuclease VII small subunit